MSRYQLDKFLAFVEGSDDAVRSYVADTAGYVAEWERRALASRLPTPDSGRLTDPQRRALVARDHAALYGLGAHPYILWHFIEAVRVWAGETTWMEMKERYRRDIAGYDTPDFST